jgi:hypothetical protein
MAQECFVAVTLSGVFPQVGGVPEAMTESGPTPDATDTTAQDQTDEPGSAPHTDPSEPGTTATPSEDVEAEDGAERTD